MFSCPLGSVAFSTWICGTGKVHEHQTSHVLESVCHLAGNVESLLLKGEHEAEIWGGVQLLRARFSGPCLPGSSVNLSVAAPCPAFPRWMSDLAPPVVRGRVVTSRRPAAGVKETVDISPLTSGARCPPHAEAATAFAAIGSPQCVLSRCHQVPVNSLLCSATACWGAAVGYETHGWPCPCPPARGRPYRK